MFPNQERHASWWHSLNFSSFLQVGECFARPCALSPASQREKGKTGIAVLRGRRMTASAGQPGLLNDTLSQGGVGREDVAKLME